MNNTRYEKPKVLFAQVFKILYPFIMLIVCSMYIAESSKYYFKLTRPCALYATLDMIILISILLFATLCCLPMKWRFANDKLCSRLVEVFISTTMSASFGCLFIEVLSTPFSVFQIFEFEYLAGEIVRAVFFVLIFFKEKQHRDSLRPLIILTGIIYCAMTLSRYLFAEYYTITPSTIAMSIAIASLVVGEIIFYDIESQFTFSCLKNRKYHIINGNDTMPKKIEYVFVVDFNWRDECLHLLTYTSDETYLDIWYDFLPEFFLAAIISMEEKKNNQEFLLISEMHKLMRNITTHSKI